MNEGEYIEQMNIRHDIEVAMEEAYMEHIKNGETRREIKFRGWYDAGEFSGWKYGYLVERYDPDGENLLWYIVNENYKGWEVEPESVGQYTGLKDKNGKAIYEGDIVKIKLYEPTIEEYYGKVHQQKGCWWIWGKSIDLLSNFNGKCEIVGNIYEDPELLGGEK